LPTVAEAGVKGFEVTSWNGLLVPAGTPLPIVQKLNTSINEAVRASDVRQRLESQGLQIVASTPEQFGQFIKAEIAKWGRVVRAAGIKAE
jgi:tripartite-type tricarboxylate transporter receptor subunit TctC